ncbi:hypothetical protein T492DRAFT_861034 [Pavlovales sp. CCMP2436]|nr:hypothetical protein T492DRAFT_861034 [Pavlovales sp. CCMP2436]
MEERDEGGRLPRFYKIGDKQIGPLSFKEAKAAERVYCPICLDALGAGLLDSRNVYEGRKDSMIAKDGHINRTHPEDWKSYKSQQLKRPAWAATHACHPETVSLAADHALFTMATLDTMQCLLALYARGRVFGVAKVVNVQGTIPCTMLYGAALVLDCVLATVTPALGGEADEDTVDRALFALSCVFTAIFAICCTSCAAGHLPARALRTIAAAAAAASSATVAAPMLMAD